MMNIKAETVALALGNREMTLTGETLEHLEEMKRASFFYLRGLDGIIRELVLMGRGPAEELTPERALELLDVASEIKGHIQSVAKIDMYTNGKHVEVDLPTYDELF